MLHILLTCVFKLSLTFPTIVLIYYAVLLDTNVVREYN